LRRFVSQIEAPIRNVSRRPYQGVRQVPAAARNDWSSLDDGDEYDDMCRWPVLSHDFVRGPDARPDRGSAGRVVVPDLCIRPARADVREVGPRLPLQGGEDWQAEMRNGERFWCFGLHGAARLVITAEPDEFLMYVAEQGVAL
jgi:hypothetical protein